MEAEICDTDNVSRKSNNGSTLSRKVSILKTSNEIEWDNLFGIKSFSLRSKTSKQQNMFGTQYSRPTSVIKKPNTFESNNVYVEEKKCNECAMTDEPLCHVELDAILKLKDSTRKLLYLLEEIHSKTHSNFKLTNDHNLDGLITAVPSTDNVQSVTDVIGANALKRLEDQAKTIKQIYVENDKDDCSVYKRLVRKCHCLNRREYNDFIIHFNEDTKYFTNTNGEIIKNMRILKKFLYMGGGYAKNALLFLNEGLSDSTYNEKVDIIDGISHADVCNVFEDYSIVIIHVSWPCNYENYGDFISQSLAAGFLYKLAQLEEGRRYLKFNSKITDDLRKLIRKKASKLDYDTLESLEATLNLIHPPLTQQVSVTYYSKPIDEGSGEKTIEALMQYRQYMTFNEIFKHLDLLRNWSGKDQEYMELTLTLPTLLKLLRNLLMEYDNSEMNIIITNILNNVLAKNVTKQKDLELPKSIITANIATEPIKLIHKSNQIPAKRSNQNKNKSKLGLGFMASKFRQSSKRKVSDWESPRISNKIPNKSKKGSN